MLARHTRGTFSQQDCRWVSVPKRVAFKGGASLRNFARGMQPQARRSKSSASNRDLALIFKFKNSKRTQACLFKLQVENFRLQTVSKFQILYSSPSRSPNWALPGFLGWSKAIKDIARVLSPSNSVTQRTHHGEESASINRLEDYACRYSSQTY